MSQRPSSQPLARLRAIIEGTRAGTWEWNVHTGELLVNERWAEMLGYSIADLEPISIAIWDNLCHPDDLLRSSDMLQRHFSGELPYYDCVCRMRHKEGHWVWIHDRGNLISHTASGEPEWAVGTHIDISEQHVTAQLVNKLAETIPGVIYILRMYSDGSFEFPYVSKGVKEFYGVAPEEIQNDGRLIFKALHPDDRDNFMESIRHSYTALDQWTCEYRVVQGGREIWLESVATPEREWHDREAVTWYGLVVDITHRKELEAKLLKLSVTDELTGLYNRRYLIKRMAELLEDYLRHGSSFALVQIDLDWFKSINDTYGHLIGDEVLKAFAFTLKNRLRKSDIAGRSGGEEFLILLPHTEADEAYELIDEIREIFASTQFQSDQSRTFFTSFSAGVTSAQPFDDRVDQLLSRADNGLYQAKGDGRNRVLIELAD